MTTRIRPVRQIEIVGDRAVLFVDPPVSSSAPGFPGQMSWDADYVYVCIALDTWKRIALETW